MKKWTDAALEKISAIARVKATPAMLHSTLGRHGARAIRAAVLSELAMKQWQLLTDNIVKGDTTIYNKPEFPKGTIEGVGFHEAPRGTLSHWSSSKTAPSRTTRPSSPPPGTPAPATPAAPSAPTSRRSWGTPSPTPNTPSKSCVPSTPSTPAWPAQSTPSTPPAATSQR